MDSPKKTGPRRPRVDLLKKYAGTSKIHKSWQGTDKPRSADIYSKFEKQMGHQSTIAPTPPLPPAHRPIVSVHKSLSTSPIETETTGLGQANTTTTSAEDSCVDQLVEKEGAANTTTIPSALHSFVPSFNSIVQVFQSRWARIRKIETETVKKEGLAFIGTDPKFCGLHEVRKEVKVRGRMEERFVRRSARINSNLLLTA